jgi:multidrug resistance efflux pump
MKKKLNLIAILLTLAILSSACGMFPASTQEPQATLPPVKATEQISAEGRLVPYKYVTLAFSVPGQVAEVLAAEGERVKSGQVLARLKHHEQAAAEVAAAQVELLNAQLALKNLTENAGLMTAQAQQKVAVARDRVRHAEWRLDSLRSGSKQVDLDSAQADVVLLRDRLDEAQKDFTRYRNKPEDDVQRATFLSKLAEAQRNYDNAVSLLNNLEGSATEIDLAIAEADLSLSQAGLLTAEQDYADVKDGPNPDDMASAEAQVEAAKTHLAAALAAQDELELKAPFSGEVVEMNLKAGEQTSPGQPAAVLADSSSWLVETDDLTEIEVVDIRVGQKASIIPDAIPDLQLPGQVESISDLFQEQRGDVLYTVKVSMNELDPRMRWGMTVEVTFENGKTE